MGRNYSRLAISGAQPEDASSHHDIGEYRALRNRFHRGLFERHVNVSSVVDDQIRQDDVFQRHTFKEYTLKDRFTDNDVMELGSFEVDVANVAML
jgi:hypothetical protein